MQCGYNYGSKVDSITLEAIADEGFVFAGFEDAATKCLNGDTNALATGKCVVNPGKTSKLVAEFTFVGTGCSGSDCDGGDNNSDNGGSDSSGNAGSGSGEPVVITVPKFCWKGTYGRGVGTIPADCPGQEKQAGLCYNYCKSGFYGVGPVCWQACPSGYTDDGAFCRKDAHIFASDNSSCPWYDKCGLTFAPGCSKCPSGYINDGCTCRRDVHIFAKASYGRGVGTPMSCSSSLQYDAGLCYQHCSSGMNGVGPVCWGSCPASIPVGCGAGCAATGGECANQIISQVTSSLEMAGNIAAAVLTFGASSAAVYSTKIALNASQRAATKAAIIEGLKKTGKDLTQDALEAAAEQVLIASMGGDFDFNSLDPTGIASVVAAFNAPICSDVGR